MPKDIFAVLTTETRPLHADMERVDLSDVLLDQTLTPEQYHWMLRQHYRFHVEVERMAVQFRVINEHPLLDYPARLKVPSLLADLKQLSVPIPVVPSTLSVERPDEALGVLYIAEGPVLGGHSALKAVEKNEALEAAAPFHYLSTYNNETVRRWREFQRVVREASKEWPGAREGILQGAIKGYEYLLNVLDAKPVAV